MNLIKRMMSVFGARYAHVTLRHPNRAAEVIADKGLCLIRRTVTGREYVLPYTYKEIEVVYLDNPGPFWRIERVTK